MVETFVAGLLVGCGVMAGSMGITVMLLTSFRNVR